MFHLSAALKAKGEQAEADFREWLNWSGIAYMYVEQSPLTVPERLRGRIKRPDYLVGIPYTGLIAFDVKAKSIYDGRLLFEVDEVEKMALFARLFHLTVYFACVDPEVAGRQWWVPLTNLRACEPVRRGKRLVLAFPTADAFEVDPAESFLNAIFGVSARALD